LRIIHVMPGIGIGGGAEQSFAVSVDGLIARGHELHLALLTDRRALGPKLEEQGVIVHDLSEGPRRFSELEDSADWIDRLKIVGIDLRDPTQVIALADEVAADGPLDILINNACQTVRRPPGSYAPLVEAESLNYQAEQFGRNLFNNGYMMPIGAAFVQETTIRTTVGSGVEPGAPPGIANSVHFATERPRHSGTTTPLGGRVGSGPSSVGGGPAPCQPHELELVVPSANVTTRTLPSASDETTSHS